MNTIAVHFAEIGNRFGQSWNRFWFTPRNAQLCSFLRITAGVLAVCFLLSHTADLVRWFGSDGLLPGDTVRQLAGGSQQTTLRPSPLYYLQSASLLWTFHGLAILVSIAFTLGLFARITNLLTLVAVLSYVHRAPMITGPFESILTMLLCYLVLAPTASWLSLDRRIRPPSPEASGTSLGANLSLQLIRLHTCGFYLLMGLTMLAGQVWWSGEAVWWLMARPDSRPFDLTGMHGQIYLINLWTHGTVFFALLFPLLIWKPLMRPVLLAMACFYWLLMGLLTGEFGFASAMVVASLSFLPPEYLGGRAAVEAGP